MILQGTTRLDTRSVLVPTSILFTTAGAYLSISLTRHGVTTEHEHQRTSCCMGCLKIKYQKQNIIYHVSWVILSILKNARFEVFIFRQNWMTPYSKWWHSIPSCPRPASIAARFWRTPGPDGREGGHKRLDFPQEDCISTRQAMDNTSCNIAIIAHSECQTRWHFAGDHGWP